MVAAVVMGKLGNSLPKDATSSSSCDDLTKDYTFFIKSGVYQWLLGMGATMGMYILREDIGRWYSTELRPLVSKRNLMQKAITGLPNSNPTCGKKAVCHHCAHVPQTQERKEKTVWVPEWWMP